MILDSSAVVSIVLREPAHEDLLTAIDEAAVVGMGAATVAETGIVLVARLGPSGKTLLSRFLTEAAVEVIPMTEAHSAAVVDAFLRYGKGRHPAGLNFGDCSTYAVALLASRPLLCVGADFARTDLSLVDWGMPS